MQRAIVTVYDRTGNVSSRRRFEHSSATRGPMRASRLGPLFGRTVFPCCRMPEPHEVSHGQVNGASSQTAAPKSKKKKKSRRRQGAPETLPISQVCCDVAARPFDMAWSPSNTQELLTASEDCVALWSVEHGAKLPQKRLQFELTSPSLRGRLSASSAKKKKPAWITAGMGHSSEQGLRRACDGGIPRGASSHRLTTASWPWSAADGSCVGGQRRVDGREGRRCTSWWCFGRVCWGGLLRQRGSGTRRRAVDARTRFQSHCSGITFGGVDRNPAGLAYVQLAARGRPRGDAVGRDVPPAGRGDAKEHIVRDEHVRRTAALRPSPTSRLSRRRPPTTDRPVGLAKHGRGPVAEVGGHEGGGWRLRQRGLSAWPPR